MGRSLGLADDNFAQAVSKLRKAANDMVSVLYTRLKASTTKQPTEDLLHPQHFKNKFDDFLSNDPKAQMKTLLATKTTVSVKSTNEVPPPPVDMLKKLLQDKTVRKLIATHLQKEASIQAIQEWSKKIQYLNRIPFDHLVPDPRMLPVESLRLFYVDSDNVIIYMPRQGG
ncbi:hypothetical protein QUF90_15730 [Desulfococcaceae bacterium HSG9]|nr:hypothetical protein [Desulfococcaceae bacterium HSG9]